MPSPKVEFSKKAFAAFKRAAKFGLPNEVYAVLLGRYTKSGVYRVLDIYVPPDGGKFATVDTVRVQCRWWSEAKEAAKPRKMRVLGDLHTHPPRDGYEPCKEPAPSTSDLEGYDFMAKTTGLSSPITGVCAMYKSKRGVECVVRFYLAAPHPKLFITA